MELEENKNEQTTEEILCGQCPDEVCQNELYYLSNQESIACSNCGQKHGQEDLFNVREVEKDLIPQLLPQLLKTMKSERSMDLVKVLGLSNYDCKLISPLLTSYGMAKSGIAKLLTDLGHNEIIDCGKVLGNRGFNISPRHLNIEGYGRDKSGSVEYLKPFLDVVKTFNNNEERLVPIHVDGDGHCLVHAISRALIGRELFWHALRVNLQQHIKNHKDQYIELFKDFHDEDEWKEIIEEASPYSSDNLTLGLGNIHIFALCNILKRPILLIDTLETINNAGDYTALFVPVFTEPDDCKNKSPLCVAWNSGGYNHFVPLVAVEGFDPPKIPKDCLPKLWGITEEYGNKYLEYNEDGSLTVACGQKLKESYLQKLVRAITVKFEEMHLVSAALVANHYRYEYCSSYSLGVQPHVMIQRTGDAVYKERLFVCLNCKAIKEVNVPELSLMKGGSLYEMLTESYENPKPNNEYSFPHKNIRCYYDQENDKLVIFTCPCNFCERFSMRVVNSNGKPKYRNGDPTETNTTLLTACGCGKKHFWNGKEYDNLPKCFSINVQNNEEDVKAIDITWFYGDTNKELNSDLNKMIDDIIVSHFPDVTETDDLRKNIKSQMLENVPGDSNESFTPNLTTNLTNKHTTEDNTVTVHSKSHAKESGLKLEPTIVDIKLVTEDYQTEEERSLNEQNPKLRIKILVQNQKPITENVDSDVTINEIQSIIFKKFNIAPELQILKQGYPPKRLCENENGCLNLQSGDSIKVTIKSETSKLPLNSQAFNPIIGDFLPKKLSNVVNANAALTQALKQEKQMQVESGYASMWDYAITKPELFQPGGVFYEQFKLDIGLKHRNHCQLPDFAGKKFQYNEVQDRVELCLEPHAGHYPINDQVQEIFDKYSKSNESSILSDFRAFNVAPGPGFRILNEEPATLTDEEKQDQKNQLSSIMKSLYKTNPEDSKK